MVGGTGIEPVTFAMSTRRSPAELTAHCFANRRDWIQKTDIQPNMSY